MALDCVLIGFYDEPMTEIISRVEPYKTQNAGYKHMLARSAIINGRPMKFSEILAESITCSTGIPSDLTNFRMPSMPVHTLTRYLRNRDIKMDFINYFNYGKERLEYLLKNDPPRCVGVSTTCQVEPAPLKYVVDFVRNINPEPVIIVGGPFINSINLELEDIQQNYLLKLIGANIYVHESQGEKTLYRLCLELRKSNHDLSAIPNLIYYQDNKFHRTEKVAENVSLDKEPVAEFTFYEDHPLPAVYLRTSRSCPQQCAFCRYHKCIRDNCRNSQLYQPIINSLIL